MAMTEQNRQPVAVCGLGAVTSFGIGVEPLWQGVMNGDVAIKPVTGFDLTGIATELGGQVDQPLPQDTGSGEVVLDYALAALDEALEQSRVLGRVTDKSRMGLVFATCMAGGPSVSAWYRKFLSQAAERGDPRLFSPQNLAERLAVHFGFGGAVGSVVTACSAGANALGYALHWLEQGRVDVVAVVGADALTDFLYAGFNSLESLSPRPAAPYSGNRSGLSLGEGAASMVLARRDRVDDWRLPVQGWLLGYGTSADGYHPTAPRPDGAGAARAIVGALNDAAVAASDVDYINGHGTGTPKNDSAETSAIKTALGIHAAKVAVSSTKSMIGHLLGAAGVVESIVTIKALQHQCCPPTANYRQRDAQCDLDYVPEQSRPAQLSIALSNNFAFGGHNACVVFGKKQRHGVGRKMQRQSPVGVTGMSVLLPGIDDPQTIWRQYLDGVALSSANDGRRRLAVKPQPYLQPRQCRRMDELSIAGTVASWRALSTAGLAGDDVRRAEVGLVFGTALGPVESLEMFYRPLIDEGLAAANPAVFPNTVFNAAAGQVAMHTGIMGASTTLANGHAAGAGALAYGYDLIQRGQADVVLCLAGDIVTDTAAAALADCADGESTALSAMAVIILERPDHARARHAEVLGYLSGYGMSFDMERAAAQAIATSGVASQDYDQLWHCSRGQFVLRQRVRQWLKAGAGFSPADNDIHRHFGDTLAASGVINAILALCHMSDAGDAAAPALVNSYTAGGSCVSVSFTPANQ